MAEDLDIRELARLIRAKRGARGLRAVAEEIGQVSASTLSRIEQGKVPDLDTYIRICRWLGVSADRFLNTSGPARRKPSSADGTTMEVVVAHLRADRTLDPDTAEALARMISLAYSAAKNGRLGKRRSKDEARV